MNLKAIRFLFLACVLYASDVALGQNLRELWQQAAKDDATGNYELAISNYSKIIDAKPKFTPAYTARGCAFVALGKFDEAIKDLSEAIRLNSTNYLAYVMRGSCYYGTQEFDKAVKDISYFLQAVTNDDSNVYKMRKSAYKIRGLAYSWERSFTNGIPDLTEALKYYPDDFEVYARRGYCYFRLDENERAFNDVNNAIRLNPKDADSLTTRGRIYSQKGSYTNAVQDLEAAIHSDDEMIVGYNSLAWILATCPDKNIRDGKRAVKLATKACDLSEWNNYNYLDTLAAAYAESDDFENAVKYQKQAASIEGISPKKLKSSQDRIDLYLHHKPFRELKSN